MIRLKIQYISFRFSLFSFILFTEDEMISLLSSCFSGSKYGMTSSIEENTDSSLADFSAGIGDSSLSRIIDSRTTFGFLSSSANRDSILISDWSKGDAVWTICWYVCMNWMTGCSAWAIICANWIAGCCTCLNNSVNWAVGCTSINFWHIWANWARGWFSGCSNSCLSWITGCDTSISLWYIWADWARGWLSRASSLSCCIDSYTVIFSPSLDGSILP